MNKLIVEKSKPSEFLDIAALDRVAWRDNGQSEFIPDGEHAWRIWCEHGVMFTAKFDDQVAEAILAFRCEDDTYCLQKVMVSNEHRGKGIGGLLFKALFEALDEKRVDYFLTVDPVNSHAIALYTSWGFDERVLVEGFYRSSEDRFVMTRRAKQSNFFVINRRYFIHNNVLFFLSI